MTTPANFANDQVAPHAAGRTIMRTLLVIVALAVAALCPPTAPAGIVDLPVPLLQGEKALHLFSISGVVTAGGLGTYVSCTSASTAAARVSVEVFDADGTTINDPSAVSVSVDPGATVMFATQNDASSAFSSVQLLTAAPVFLQLGSARVLSTTKALVCTAFLADAYNGPPASMTPLVVVSKLKQRGG